MKIPQPGFNPVDMQRRLMEAQGNVQKRAMEVLKKSQDGTLNNDAGFKDMMETQQKWAQSDAMQAFNPMNVFRGGMTQDQATIQQLAQRAQLGDVAVATQLQMNFDAIQSLALGARVGVSFDKVQSYLENAAAQALLTGDHQTFQRHTQALAGLEAASALIPGYEQAARSIPTHKKQPGTGPLAKGTKENVGQTASAVKSGLANAAKQSPPSAEVAALMHDKGRLKSPNKVDMQPSWMTLHYDNAKVNVGADGKVALNDKPLSATDGDAILRGMMFWAHNGHKISTKVDIELIIGKAMSADIPEAKRKALRDAPSALVDSRPTIVKAKIDDWPHPLAAHVALHDVELVKTPKEASRGTLLVDPSSGSVKMRTDDDKLYDIAKDDLMRVYQSLRANSNPPAGFDAFLHNLEAAIIRSRQ